MKGLGFLGLATLALLALPASSALGQVSIYPFGQLAFTVPASAEQGQSIRSQVNLVFQNVGPDTLRSLWLDMQLTKDPTTDPGTSIGFCFVDVLPPGAVYTADFSACMTPPTIPVLSPTGLLYLFPMIRWHTDVSNRVALGAEPITITPIPSATVYYQDFQPGPSGWTPVNMNAQDIHLQRVSYIDQLGNPRGVWWCGANNPVWPGGSGYGNGWDQRLTKTFTLPGVAPIGMGYTLQFDTKCQEDYVRVEISQDGGTSFTLVGTHSCSSGGAFQDFILDLSPYAGRTVQIRFRFLSDARYSDEDGAYNSDGAFRLDKVYVSGYGVDDFESGDGGWVPSVNPIFTMAYRLEGQPVCPPGLPCDMRADGSPMLSCNGWVAYDPATGRFPAISPADAAVGVPLRFGIESPVLEVPTDATHTVLYFDVFRDLPTANGIYYNWEVSSPAGSPWRQGSATLQGTDGWFRQGTDITTLMTPGAGTLQLRLVAFVPKLMSVQDPGVITAGPFFDNVQLVATNTASTGLDPTLYPRACGATLDDADGDGVPLASDLCPTVSAARFDRDGDGCPDPVIGGRHVEYWAAGDSLRYVVNQSGAPGITDGSDLTAIRAAFASWAAVPGAEVASRYAGRTAQADAQALDHVNLITFDDPDFVFPSGVLAVGLSTSFVLPNGDGAGARPGQIVDADMILNPAYTYKTATQGSGIDLQSIVTHEAGHMLGLSHSAVVTSTMFYVLQPGTGAASLEAEDRLAILKAYPSAQTLQTTSHLLGSVIDATNNPLTGVAVFAVAAATGDTLGCEYTLPDGSFHFIGLPQGDYYLGIHGLDGTSSIGYLQPGNINDLIAGKAATAVIPEWWDAAESSHDDPSARTAIPVAAGGASTAVVIANVDQTGPTILTVSPAPDATAVPTDAAVLVRFSEGISGPSLKGNFVLSTSPGGSLVPGNAALIEDGHTLAYVPAANLAFDTTYYVLVRAGVQDLFGNGLAAPDTFRFTVRPRPPLALDALSPNKGAPGSVLVLSGNGFAPTPADNLVYFGTVALPVLQASPTQLVVTVPAGAVPGAMQVHAANAQSGETSNALTYTVLAPEQAPRAYEIASVNLGSPPRALAVSPDGGRVFVATAAGLSAVDVSTPSAPVHTPVPVTGGLNALDLAAGGGTVFAVSSAAGTLCRFQANPPLLLDEKAVGAEPRGLLIDAVRGRAYIPTAEGTIQIWDVHEGSPTYDTQIGVLTSPDLNLTGRLALDAAGNRLLALSGAGQVQVYDLALGLQTGSVPVLGQPRDLTLDPGGQVLYVTDATGFVSLVSLATSQKVLDIATGGAPRGVDIGTSGSFAYVADYQLDYLDVIDLRSGSPTWRQVAARLPQRQDPLDLAFAPNGQYAFCLAEAESKLVVEAVGSGPLLASVTPEAAPVGATVVLAGSGLGGGRVFFGNLEAAVARGNQDMLVATVPPGASSGPVTVLGTAPSNPVAFEVLGPTPAGGFRLQAALAPQGLPALSGTLAVAPDGRLLGLGTETGEVRFLDIDPASPSFYQFVDHAPAGQSNPITGLAFSPDSSLAYAAVARSSAIRVITTDRAQDTFGEVKHLLAVGVSDPTALALGPDGRVLAVADSSTTTVALVDLKTGTIADASLGSAAPGLSGRPGEIVFHPGGALAYVVVADESPAVVLVLNADPTSTTFGAIKASVPLPPIPVGAPHSLAFAPDGSRCWVLTGRLSGLDRDRFVVALDTSNPLVPTVITTTTFAELAPAMQEQIRVSPAGDRALVGTRLRGVRRLALPSLAPVDTLPLQASSAPFGVAYDPRGRRVFVATTFDDSLRAYDFGASLQLAGVWGQGQIGVIGQALPSPLRVRVTDPATGVAQAGTPVTFLVTTGGGHFTSAAGGNSTVLTLGTDQYGYAQTEWVMGPVIGTETVTVSAPGAGLPLTYIATAVDDPATQPLMLVESQLAPPPGAVNVSVTTAVQAVFSRAVATDNLAHVFYLSADGGVTAVPAVLGLADGNRSVSLTPSDQLAYGKTYTLILSGVHDAAGGLLSNPQTPTFTTAAAPPAPTLTAASPPSAAATMDVVLSGSGFSPTPGQNAAWFNDRQAAVTASAADWVRTAVPVGAVSGTVRVETGGHSSGTIPFTVIVPSSSAPEEVIASVGTGSSTRSVTVSPDGAMLYAVSPDADLVVPVTLPALTTLAGIPVGDQPWALTVDPAGHYLYIANRLSGDVSIVDGRSGSPTRHQVVGSLQVGTYPVDIAVSPDGDRVLVANAGSGNLSVIDSDPNSSSFHRVIATANTGSAARSVTVAPDGSLIYVGTDAGYTVIDPVAYGVVRSVPAGSATQSVTVSPDGTLLILIDAQGQVWIYDVAPGSARQDQVIATAPAGSSVRSATVSPDGGLLYLLLEDGSTVLVYSLDIGTSVGVVAPGGRTTKSLTLVSTLSAGENPADLAFNPQQPGTFYVANAGDNTISVFGHPAEGKIGGRVYADCPVAGTGLAGVPIDVFASGTGELVRALTTDQQGRYQTSVSAGDYILSLVTPLGYLSPLEQRALTVAGGDSLNADWPVRCTVIVPKQRTLSFWKHQLGAALNGHAPYEIDGPTLCGYLDLVQVHFNSNLLNPVEVYTPPATGQCVDKLQSLRGLLNLEGDVDMLAQAKQELMALLLNVASQKLALTTRISSDGATVSQAITYCDHLIDDGDSVNDETAMKIAKNINMAKLVGSGVIPRTVPQIAYAPKRFALNPSSPNPFNPATRISFDVAAAGQVKLLIYDLAGRLVRTLVDEVRQPGTYEEIWNGRDDRGGQAASGVYFYRFEAGGFVQTRKMMLVK